MVQHRSVYHEIYENISKAIWQDLETDLYKGLGQT